MHKCRPFAPRAALASWAAQWHRRRSWLVLILLLGLIATAAAGVSAASLPADQGHTSPAQVAIPAETLLTPITHIPTRPHRFSLVQKLNPIWWFGNADDPVPPDWYRPGQHHRNLLWHIRNPWHNFDCYVIGLSDRTFTRAGRYPGVTFNPHGGWNWAICRYHWLRLPFLSYSRGRFRFYCGWRTSGAFGSELRAAGAEHAHRN